MALLDQIAFFVKKKIGNIYLIDYDMKNSMEGRDLETALVPKGNERIPF